jgi:hypothetical protein
MTYHNLQSMRSRTCDAPPAGTAPLGLTRSASDRESRPTLTAPPQADRRAAAGGAGDPGSGGRFARAIFRGQDHLALEGLVERIGQDLFRDALTDYWSGRCPLTGITDPALLRASHIVPWAECCDAQRLDVHNGLLLSALWDAAFEISFADDGTAFGKGKLAATASLPPASALRGTTAGMAIRAGAFFASMKHYIVTLPMISAETVRAAMRHHATEQSQTKASQE